MSLKRKSEDAEEDFGSDEDSDLVSSIKFGPTSCSLHCVPVFQDTPDDYYDDFEDFCHVKNLNGQLEEDCKSNPNPHKVPKLGRLFFYHTFCLPLIQ